MRGTLGAEHEHVLERGIIPADAGNTLPLLMALAISRDHPRGCGEHYFIDSLNGFGNGSSPRMRGTHDVSYGQDDDEGIIPADAGNTTYPDPPPTGRPDHPRGCGEHG